MIDIIANKRDGMHLLFWRAFADLGVAVRFVTTYSLNEIACGHASCYLPTGWQFLSKQCKTILILINLNLFTDDQTLFVANCGFPSAFLEFFEIASEMWFLCIAIDLWKSLINPFSSTSSW